MLKLDKDIKYLEQKIDTFIWEFKIKDNILYNLDLVYDLVSKHNSNEKKYCKPISILAVSIVEAMMIDFVWRLYSATNHFPNKQLDQKEQIKRRLYAETKAVQSIFEDEEYQYRRLRNFRFTDLINLFEDFKLVGNKEKDYKFLRHIAHFRNRVHIKNYYNNFEKDESRVFTESRTQKILNSIIKITDYFSDNYSRPWN